MRAYKRMLKVFWLHCCVPLLKRIEKSPPTYKRCAQEVTFFFVNGCNHFYSKGSVGLAGVADSIWIPPAKIRALEQKGKKKKKKLHVENMKTINSQLQARLSHTEHVHTSSSQHSGKINKNIFTQLDASSTAVFKIDKERDRSATRTGKRRSSREVISFGIYGKSASKSSKTYRQFFFFFLSSERHTHTSAL